MKNVTYLVNTVIEVADFIDLLNRSTLAERRPVDNETCIRGMLENSNLLVSAWQAESLIGIVRCVTDFHYCCYLSDLAVDERYQNQGIGQQLQKRVAEQLKPTCKLVLLAAPAANNYYAKIGYERHPRCWVKSITE